MVMERNIYKYQLELKAEQVLESSYMHFKPLHVGLQKGTICLWAEVGSLSMKGNIRIACFGTGQSVPINTGFHHIGTVQQNGLVWHFYMNAHIEHIKEA